MASAVSGAAVSRMSFVDLSETEWPLGAPAVYVANHRSIFDVVAGLRTFDHLGIRPRLIVAERFFQGTAGRALSAVGALPALRGSDATTSAAAAAVTAGESVAFMVEGKLTTRADSRDAAHGRGAPTVAALTGVPVVPLGSWGTDRPWPRPRPWPVLRFRRPKIAVAIGPPIRHRESSPTELGRRIRASLDELELIAGRHIGDPAAFVDDGTGCGPLAARNGMVEPTRALSAGSRSAREARRAR
jgi:1-acyl-sn-glycerol-3-phosphate acyltransferase